MTSLWGKIIGGVGGFALGGPLGALLGAVAGHAVDRWREEHDEHREGRENGRDGTRQIAFTIGVIALGAKMAKADGQVTRDEVQAFKQVFRVPPGEMRNVARVFNLARTDAHGFEPYARQIARLFEPGSQVLEDLLHGLFHIAKADSVVQEAELDYLRRVAEIFGFDEAGFARIREYHIGADRNDPYTILGVPHDASDGEVKAAWRRLIRENHPDQAIARGLPEEFVDLANEKLAAINDAYDRIARSRGLN
ncbi:MAG TPA: TerB family tellurite resistance protein [Alphaproteobacteria bacterium]|jgi:DnaJ like chaperone protein|nr:TerB family tellurite resistance protein [Alphaproteobacteria bacterium]